MLSGTFSLRAAGDSGAIQVGKGPESVTTVETMGLGGMLGVTSMGGARPQ